MTRDVVRSFPSFHKHSIFQYKEGKHYLSDIIAGALIGTIAGYGVPYMHRKKDKGLVISPVAGIMTGISTPFIF